MRELFDLRCAETGKILGHQLYELLAEISVLGEFASAAMNGEIEIDTVTPRVVVRLNVSDDPIEAVFVPEGAETVSDDAARRCTILPTASLAKIAIALRRGTAEAA